MAPPRVVTEGGTWAEAPAGRGDSVQAQGTKAQRQDRACHAGNAARAVWPDGSKAAPRKARLSAVPEPEPEGGRYFTVVGDGGRSSEAGDVYQTPLIPLRVSQQHPVLQPLPQQPASHRNSLRASLILAREARWKPPSTRDS